MKSEVDMHRKNIAKVTDKSKKLMKRLEDLQDEQGSFTTTIQTNIAEIDEVQRRFGEKMKKFLFKKYSQETEEKILELVEKEKTLEDIEQRILRLKASLEELSAFPEKGFRRLKGLWRTRLEEYYKEAGQRYESDRYVHEKDLQKRNVATYMEEHPGVYFTHGVDIKYTADLHTTKPSASLRDRFLVLFTLAPTIAAYMCTSRDSSIWAFQGVILADGWIQDAPSGSIATDLFTRIGDARPPSLSFPEKLLQPQGSMEVIIQAPVVAAIYLDFPRPRVFETAPHNVEQEMRDLSLEFGVPVYIRKIAQDSSGKATFWHATYLEEKKRYEIGTEASLAEIQSAELHLSKKSRKRLTQQLFDKRIFRPKSRELKLLSGFYDGILECICLFPDIISSMPRTSRESDSEHEIFFFEDWHSGDSISIFTPAGQTQVYVKDSSLHLSSDAISKPKAKETIETLEQFVLRKSNTSDLQSLRSILKENATLEMDRRTVVALLGVHYLARHFGREDIAAKVLSAFPDAKIPEDLASVLERRIDQRGFLRVFPEDLGLPREV